LWFCDNVAALKEGRLLAVGRVESVMTRELLGELYNRHIYTEQVGQRTFIHP
jgi:ABC-type enterochelin transport system ATPase subunit